MKNFALITVIAVACVLWLGNPAWGCPGCSAALSVQAGTSQELKWGAAFCDSILFMLVVVHSFIFFGAYKVYKLIKSDDEKYSLKPKVSKLASPAPVQAPKDEVQVVN